MPVLDLRDHVIARCAENLGRCGGGRAVRVPSRSVQSGCDALGHEGMIGRVKLDVIAAESLSVVCVELRSVLVC
jgi:hypothetical protein